ncbi:MAG TPA: glycoside hydrolase family 28 protein [Fimbriimonadaceae bacterium]|nr:glycoside hydrolase family 28 protein [Fimbriimonadaceae bacterium]
MSDKGVFNIQDFHAVPDGKTFCTKAIQSAVDACAASHGGTVYVPPGTYLSGALELRSHVALHLDAGATILGSPDKDDYPVHPSKTASRTNRYNLRSLILAEGLENVAITGRGTLDGNGSHFKDRRHDGERPLILRMNQCRGVLVQGITMQNSGFWNQHYLLCERVRVNGIRVWNHATYNVDAIDIDACRNFLVSDCIFDSDDDAVCLKGTLDQPCEQVVITNCTISSHCNAIKMGTDSSGGFKDIAISNCSIVSPRGSKAIYGLDRGISGISLELVDGGAMERVAISNITIDGVEVPIFVRLGARGSGMFPTEAEARAGHAVGHIRDVTLSNILATNAGQTGCSIVGIPGHDIENLTLDNVTIRTQGGGLAAWTEAEVPENHDKYPEATMFGKLPSYGLYCRHASGLALRNVRIEADSEDTRPALVFDDVREGVVHGLRTSQPGTVPHVRIHRSRDILFTGCLPRGNGSFLAIRDAETAKVGLVGNDFRQVGMIGEPGEKQALQMAGNLEPSGAD